jgi:hypothetical protein
MSASHHTNFLERTYPQQTENFQKLDKQIYITTLNLTDQQYPTHNQIKLFTFCKATI